ncbi:tRNA (adenosine(37)-N6)-threonylcarbamoyltransferase complex ATPase subunit type 1 TsaE [Helicobacter sp. MIT 99-5507]|uniref:tRNA (adenosine(37)-N6)-threonylcarbamoyltransferase complex ATPase subunit type 1 TsaE n=1 Tax=Helicobacter sp. MIT 99-5507 TaxID=152489 RepID=UPI000E1E40A1|nr:tRNA (adenosine(37)-N6)-threonylcarbamoyltransferase complex ATPase subunit type 1 TsaE [Helicobacter sp. MIT 99-5507]RDU58014.1 tRNA (adenosine(37)-N6)-threonylcarbamoyltransferase complex ATPase subunit type 1 TsaE [Helicobacter sp. MIT 99-5507]
MLFSDIDLNNLIKICFKIDEISKDKEHIIFLLYGDIGAGKTSLVKEYAKFCNIKDIVTSPTFSLLHEYDDKIFHYDLYNREMSDLLNLGILDLLSNNGIHFVEWADDNLKEILQEAFSNIITIKIDKNLQTRNYEIG